MNERFHNEKVFELFALCALYMANPIQFDPNCNGRAHTPAMLKLMPGLGKWVCLCVAIAFNAILLAYAINWCMCEIGMRAPVFNAFFFFLYYYFGFFSLFCFQKKLEEMWWSCAHSRARINRITRTNAGKRANCGNWWYVSVSRWWHEMSMDAITNFASNALSISRM